jgi:hypothetical protein
VEAHPATVSRHAGKRHLTSDIAWEHFFAARSLLALRRWPLHAPRREALMIVNPQDFRYEGFYLSEWWDE